MSGTDEIRAFANWLAGRQSSTGAAAALHAAADLLAATKGANPPFGLQSSLERYTGIPTADRALADAAGLAAIAGQWGVSTEEVLVAVGLVKNLVLAFL